ncbi:hypothetical protein M0805_006220 [Coniferiporia weirii]|nr:hypothetical protein M0805_006220 [Coniferiporia weirii]
MVDTSTVALQPELAGSQEPDLIESQGAGVLLVSADDAPKIPSLPHPLKPLTATYSYHSSRPVAKGPYMLGVPAHR